ncbi:glucosyltransferase domain-containing protein [Pantoea sp. NSTU24]|uniref:glucosyltransferase domain-containing protein n=1 Tax=Pantoea sp. NSTU24 TaxID=3391144 RepID=UPI003D08D4B6
MIKENLNYDARILTFASSLFFCLIAYGFSLSNHTISIDVDVMDNYLHTIDLGRWGHAVLKKYVFHEPWIPFFSLAFSLLCLSICSVVIVKYLQLSRTESFLFSALFVTFPQMAYQLQFSNQAETVGLALLACCYSLIVYSSGTYKSKITFIIINVLVISIYQSFVFLPITLIALFHLKKMADCHGSLKKWLYDSFSVSLLTIISVAIYFCISKLFKSHYHINDVSYFSALIAWGKIDFFDAVIGVYKFILYQCYLITWYGFNLYFLTAIAIVAIVVSSAKKDIRFLLPSIILSCIAILSPFILNILIGAGTPARTLSQIPLVFAAILVIGMQAIKKDFIKYFIAITIALSNCAYVNILFYSDKISEDQTYSISSSIINTMYRTYPETAIKETPVYFSGKINLKNPWKPERADEFGISFYERGESDRIGNYIRNTGLANILQVGKYSVSNAQKEALQTMPSWPQDGYIKEIDGKILVKLSN